MNRLERIVAAGGVLALLVALVGVFLGDPPALVDAIGSTLSDSWLPFGLTALFAILGLKMGLDTTVRRADEPPFYRPPETARDRDVDRTGAGIDDSYDRLTEDGASGSGYRYRRDRLVADLQAAAIEVVADAEGITTHAARERVEDGSWTDDSRASAFLATDGRRLPLETRIRDWLSGAGIERNVDNTLEAIQTIAAVPDSRHERSERTASEVDRDGSAVRGGGIEGGELELTDSSRTEQTTVTTADTEDRSDTHWSVGMVVAFLLTGIGVLLSNPTLVLAAAVPTTFAIYGAVTRPPETNLDVERVVSDVSPVPGEPVEVSLSVTNVGGRPIAEVRAVDGVPDALSVIDGSPRLCVSLGPGESVTTTYTVESLRGEHSFGDVSLWARNVSGEVERSATAELATTLSCRGTVESMPTTRQTTPYQGRIETDSGGAGLEFFATREYQHNDPLNRIDWNYWAQTGAPRTVEFRQSKAGTVVIVLDDRSVSRKSRHEHTPDAVTLGRYAAIRIAEALLDESNAVGAALLSTRAYERPGRGREQSQVVRSFFETSPESASSTSDTGFSLENVEGRFFSGLEFDHTSRSTDTAVDHWMLARDGGGIPSEWLRERLPGRAQIVFVSPLLDDAPRRFLRRIQADGADVTVISPNVTSEETPGSTIARIERHERLRSLRRRQFRIVDWDTATPLSVALERAQHRWSR